MSSRDLRGLPSVDRVIEALSDGTHHERAEAARAAVDDARRRVMEGEKAPGFEELVEDARARIADAHRRSLVAVINATGVLIHTNLGRVPLSREQLDRVAEVAGGYSNLEYDIYEGRRGSRYSHATETLRKLTGAEDALVVNNNAAAVLLVLSALCADREVIISRGELIEIGGEFRIPDVMTTSSARLVEVGTTNRTHLADYERAIGPDTGAVMKVHTSNFRVVGFTASVAQRDLARLALGRGLRFVEDLGSGLVDLEEAIDWTRAEPPVRTSIEAGADVVTFSGDKLLGGPQAGLIVGRRESIELIKRHPLLRAVRVDKMTLAALQVTLDSHLEGTWRELPFWRMALEPVEAVEARATAVVDAIEPDVVAKIEIVRSGAVIGGGSVPGHEIPSFAVSIEHPERNASELHAELRRGTPPVIARIEDDRLLLDMRTVPASALENLTARLATLLT